MGWGKLFGDIAKDLASDYLRERGAKGAVEDLGSMAKGVKNFFSGDDDTDEADDAIVDMGIYDELIEHQNYQEAIEYVKSSYQGEQTDYIYDYLLGNAYLHFSLDEEDEKYVKQAENHLKKALNRCPIATDDAAIIKERLKEADEAIPLIKQKKEYINAWHATLEKVHNLTNQGQFNLAIDTLIQYYKEYDGGELDFYYWIEVAEIHYAAHQSQKEEKMRTVFFDEFISDLNNASKLAQDTDNIARVKEMRGWKRHEEPVLEGLSDKNTEINAEAEKEYRDEFLACLADDGEISDRERRLLDKLRKSLGISEERALQIENESKNGGLSEQEQEYIVELKECLADGQISEREERLLQKLRKSLGISEDRGAELRKMVE